MHKPPRLLPLSLLVLLACPSAPPPSPPDAGLPPPECTAEIPCGAGERCTDAGVCVPLPKPTLTVSPLDAVIIAGSPKVTFTAVVENTDVGPVDWQLEGPGTLTVNGDAADYLPPEPTFVPVPLFAVLRARLPSLGLEASTRITVDPKVVPLLTVSPFKATVVAGGPPVSLTATLVSAAGQVTWMTTSPGGLGPLSGLQTAYLPPSVSAVTQPFDASITAEVVGGGTAQATATITVLPAPATLDLLVRNVPSGLTPTVTVTGPAGYSRTVLTSETLTGLAAGSYTVTAAPLRSGTIVDTIWAAPATTLQLQPGELKTALVDYARRGGSGALWVASLGAWAVESFTEAQLATSGTTLVATNVGLSSAPRSLAFDAVGNLWVGTFDGTVQRVSPPSLQRSGTVSPDLKLVMAGVSDVRHLAFAPDGTLWFTEGAANQFDAASASQLSVSATVTPKYFVVPTLPGAWGLAFDKRGWLWVSSPGPNGHLAAFSPTTLAGAGAAAPDIDITGPATLLNTPMGIAFDAQGSLWVALKSGPNSLLRFSPSSLAASGAPAPATALQVVNGMPPAVNALDVAIDKQGMLWILDANFALQRLPSSATVTSGTVYPIWTAQMPSLSTSLAFSPPDSSLPLCQ